MPSRKSLHPGLILLAVAMATRLIALGNPILHVDEQFYFAVAHGWARGALPYVDIWDRKPIGLFLLYLPAGMLPLKAGIWAYQLMALASAWATAMLVVALAARCRVDPPGEDRGALLAGIAYLVWIILAEGEGGQTPVFYNLLTATAALLILGAPGERPRLREEALAMLLIGTAIEINPIIVFEGCFFGIWALWRHWQRGRGPLAILGIAIPLVAAALLPTFVAAGSYAAIGHVGDWWFANAQSIFGRNIDPPAERFGNLAIIVALLSPLMSMAVIGLLMRAPWRGDARGFLIGWLAVSLVALLLFGAWFDHYALRSMLPACVCASAALGAHREIRRWAPGVLLVAAIGGQALLVSKLLTRGTPAQFDRLVAAVGDGPGCLFVYSGEPMLYAASPRCALTRYQFPQHLTRTREAGAIGVDQATELARIIAQKPAVIVVGAPFRGENPALRHGVLAQLTGSYRASVRLRVGNTDRTVYRRR